MRAEAHAGLDLFLEVMRYFSLQEGAHLISESTLLGGQTEIHIGVPRLFERPAAAR